MVDLGATKEKVIKDIAPNIKITEYDTIYSVTARLENLAYRSTAKYISGGSLSLAKEIAREIAKELF